MINRELPPVPAYRYPLQPTGDGGQDRVSDTARLAVELQRATEQLAAATLSFCEYRTRGDMEFRVKPDLDPDLAEALATLKLAYGQRMKHWTEEVKRLTAALNA
jgi:hypothetical protein